MKRDKVIGLVCLFASILLVFCCISGIRVGHEEIASNAIWALGYTLLYAIRDSLLPATQRIFNLVLFGAFALLSSGLLLLAELDVKEVIVLSLVFFYCIYRFFEAYTLEIE
jgi:hypothetical protein